MPVRYLLDTNIADYVIKGNVPNVRERLVKIPMPEVGISAITEAELRFGGADQIDGLTGGGAFPNHIYFGLVSQELAELLSSKHFIIGQNSMNHQTPYPVSCLVGLSENCRGSVKATRTLPCASSSIVKAWPFP